MGLCNILSTVYFRFLAAMLSCVLTLLSVLYCACVLILPQGVALNNFVVQLSAMTIKAFKFKYLGLGIETNLSP